MIHFEYRPESGFILTVLSGEVSGEDLTAHFEKLVGIDDDSGNMRGLSVVTGDVKFSGLVSASLLGAGRSLKRAKFLRGSRNAIVAFSPTGYRLAQLYEVASNINMRDDETRAFRGEDMESAFRWLGVEAMSAELMEVIDRVAS